MKYPAILASLEDRRFRSAAIARAPKTSKSARLMLAGYLAAMNDALRILTAESSPTTNNKNHRSK